MSGAAPTIRRRWFRFGLGTFLMFVAAVAVSLSLMARQGIPAGMGGMAVTVTGSGESLIAGFGACH